MDELAVNRELCTAALRCWFLTGATAVGKTAISIRLASALNAEIISLDSMSIYRGMDIGTAKPPLELRQHVPHHLIDIRDPHETFSVSQYRDLAHAAIDEIRARGKEVLFVGGSALYLKAMLRGLFQGPPADWDFRREVEAEVAQTGDAALHDRLRQVDPVSAHRLHVNDRRRIIRALEVLRLTGKPISHWQLEFDYATPGEQCRVFTIRRPRAELHERIAARVEGMFQQGLVDEVKRLLETGRELSHTAQQAVGYCEVLAYLAGAMDLPTTKERVLIRTRRFARHQETWFRGLSECRILDLTPDESPDQTVERILTLGSK
jgi:tRNA dimethylallyltransferase